MFQYFRDRATFAATMKHPPYEHYFEAYHRHNPGQVVRVLPQASTAGIIAYTDPEIRDLKYERGGSIMFELLPILLASRLEHDLYQAKKQLVVNHLEKIIDLSKLQQLSYPVYIDSRKHTWYIIPQSKTPNPDDFTIELFCPTRSPFVMTVTWSHGPLSWLFYNNGNVNPTLREEYWLPTDHLFTPIE